MVQFYGKVDCGAEENASIMQLFRFSCRFSREPSGALAFPAVGDQSTTAQRTVYSTLASADFAGDFAASFAVSILDGTLAFASAALFIICGVASVIAEPALYGEKSVAVAVAADTVCAIIYGDASSAA